LLLPRRAASLLAAFILLLVCAPAAVAATGDDDPVAEGAKRILYKAGPFEIKPGQNTIELEADKVPNPKVDGFITRIRPDLLRSDGTVPAVDVIHLHHGVWINTSRPNPTGVGVGEQFFAAGEEKTIFTLPKGYGLAHRAGDKWMLNHMIHNLTSQPEKVWITYELDVIPRTDPAAKRIKPASPLWMDVEDGKAYPVFDVPKGGGDGSYTYPDDDPRAYAGRRRLNEWTVDRDGVLLATAGHLHPGGLYTDMWLRRPGASPQPAAARSSACRARRARTAADKRRCATPAATGDLAHLFRSQARYWEPAGAVSWDVAMTATPSDWRVEVHKGDTLSISATYDSQRASWYESMGIMITYWAPDESGPDPFRTKVDWPGKVTHGHLPENDNHGGEDAGLPNAASLADGPAAGEVGIENFLYEQGDLTLSGAELAPPTVNAGQSLRFVNRDAHNPTGEPMHTITACKAPCNQSTGIAYPLADADIPFDSGNLGFGPRFFTAAANRDSWETPKSLPDGTYNYFCRVHPFMRGAFRVVG